MKNSARIFGVADAKLRRYVDAFFAAWDQERPISC